MEICGARWSSVGDQPRGDIDRVEDEKLKDPFMNKPRVNQRTDLPLDKTLISQWQMGHPALVP